MCVCVCVGGGKGGTHLYEETCEWMNEMTELLTI